MHTVHSTCSIPPPGLDSDWIWFVIPIYCDWFVINTVFGIIIFTSMITHCRVFKIHLQRSDQLLPFRQRLTRVIRVIRWKIREMSKVNTVNTLLVNTVNTLFGQRLTRYKYLWLTRLIRVIRVIH